MGRFVTPDGVVIEMGAEAARVIGYKPAEEKAEPKKQPAKRAAEKSEK